MGVAERERNEDARVANFLAGVFTLPLIPRRNTPRCLAGARSRYLGEIPGFIKRHGYERSSRIRARVGLLIGFYDPGSCSAGDPFAGESSRDRSEIDRKWDASSFLFGRRYELAVSHVSIQSSDEHRDWDTRAFDMYDARLEVFLRLLTFVRRARILNLKELNY